MNRPVRTRSTRDRPAKAPLSEEAIVDAALDILRSEGLESISMRRVASALDTGAASLYVYVAGREGLLAAMLDRVTATVELEPPDPSRWRAQLHSLLQRMHDALIAHPGIAAITIGDPPTTETLLTVMENLLGILLAGGLDLQDAAWACDILFLLVTASAHEQDLRGPQDFDLKVDEIHTTFTALPPERFPLVTAYADELVSGDGALRFRFAVDVMVDGLVARSKRGKASRST